MKKFVVAHYSLFDNELKQELVEAEDAFHAAISYLGYEKQDTNATTLEDLQEELWNCDEQVSVLEVKNNNRISRGVGSLPPVGFVAMQ